VFGSVRALNGQPERGVTLEAVPEDSGSNSITEEAQTDEEGKFRLRGLQTGARYSVRVRVTAGELALSWSWSRCPII
jgi:hypothetical protein